MESLSALSAAMKTYQRFAGNPAWDRYAAFLLRSISNRPKLSPMTVCIGALCMNGKAVVMAADRAVSASAFGLSGEGPDRKIEQLSSRRLLACAGETPPNALIEEFREGRFAEASPAEAAEAIYRACLQLQHKKFEQQATRPFLDIDYQTFLQQSTAGQIPPPLVDAVCKIIRTYQPVNSYLLASSASDGIHLYGVAEGSGVIPLDRPGFGAIGAGTEPALTVLYRNTNIKMMSLASAVYFVYEAKKAAERKNGVGEETDMAILFTGQDACFLSKEAIASLEATYQSKRPPNLTNAESDSIQALLPNFNPPVARE
jgi:20S proteasome alpha/beta subunit